MPTTVNGLPVPLDTDPVSDGAKAIRDLATALGGGEWTSLTLNADWSGFAEYRVVAGGIVFLRGRCTRAAAGSNTIAMLPAAAWPSGETVVGMVRMGSSTCACAVRTTGEVAVGNYSNGQEVNLTSVPSYSLG